MTERSEAVIRRPMMERILAAAGKDMILVGGQALSFWAAYYEVQEPIAAITKDADFLGTRDDVRRIALALVGRAKYPLEKQLTALVGQIEKDLPGGEYINIDVMFRVYGDVSVNAIRSRAVVAELPGATVRVMHPMDVLQGRLENVHGLPEKRDAHGLEQLKLAIGMVRAFLIDEASRQAPASRPTTLKHISRIEEMALSDAGRKVAKRFGVHVADSIEVAAALHLRGFRAKKLPQLMGLMSGERQRAIEAVVADASRPR
jgi:hypothetical protein